MMRNHIPKVAKVVVIEDFYQVSNDPAMPPPNNYLGRRPSTSLRMSGLRTSLEAQSPYRPHREGTRTSN
jgi:hypothetical protein